LCSPAAIVYQWLIRVNVRWFTPSKEIADFILNEAGVASLSGAAFGEYGEGYLRFSYANSLPNILEAIARIRKALDFQR